VGCKLYIHLQAPLSSYLACVWVESWESCVTT
jgi:hypothetical protein